MTSQFLRLVVRPEDDVAKLIDGMASYARTLQPEPQQYREFGTDFNDDPLTGDLPMTGTGIMNLGSLSNGYQAGSYSNGSYTSPPVVTTLPERRSRRPVYNGHNGHNGMAAAR
jgi:hypothetical protein